MADCNYCTNYHCNSYERIDDCCLGKGDCRKEYFSCNEGLKPKAAKPVVSHSSAPKKVKSVDKDEVIYAEVTRRFDDLGRINIPKDVRRKALGTSDTDGKMMKIFYKTDGTIILKPWVAEG